MKINMTEWMDGIIRSKEVTAVPVMTHPGIEITGNSVLDAVSNGDVHHKAIAALAEKYPTAAATVIMDLTVEAEAFGAEISFTRDEVPAVIGHMLNGLNGDDLADLAVQNFLADGRIEWGIAQHMADHNLPVCFFCYL